MLSALLFFFIGMSRCFASLALFILFSLFIFFFVFFVSLALCVCVYVSATMYPSSFVYSSSLTSAVAPQSGSGEAFSVTCSQILEHSVTFCRQQKGKKGAKVREREEKERFEYLPQSAGQEVRLWMTSPSEGVDYSEPSRTPLFIFVYGMMGNLTAAETN